MSIVGIFSKSRPAIGGLFFDALLEESSELITDVSEYPIETGVIGNDHAVQRPLRLTMTVGLSDNAFRAAKAAASEFGTLAESLAGGATSIGVGAAISQLGGGAAAAVGVAGSVINGLMNPAGSAATRSGTMLENIRALQRSRQLIDVVGAKNAYSDVMITNTRTQVTKQNEGGLELVVELRQLVVVGGFYNAVPKTSLPTGDTAATQAQSESWYGEVALQ